MWQLGGDATDELFVILFYLSYTQTYQNDFG